MKNTAKKDRGQVAISLRSFELMYSSPIDSTNDSINATAMPETSTVKNMSMGTAYT
jgi:hypothetical protein